MIFIDSKNHHKSLLCNLPQSEKRHAFATPKRLLKQTSSIAVSLTHSVSENQICDNILSGSLDSKLMELCSFRTMLGIGVL